MGNVEDLCKHAVAKNAENNYQYFMTDKQLALETISKLPDDISIEEIAEDVEILAAIRQGEADIAGGRFKTHEEVEKLLASWTTK